MTAGIAVGHMHGLSTIEAIKLGVAAGAGNVIRRGLGSGSRDLIGELSELVELQEV
jgi:1-phosphofructokinase